MNQGFIIQKTAQGADLSAMPDLSGDPIIWQRNERFLPRWKMLAGGYADKPQSERQSGDAIEQALRPFTGPLFTNKDVVDTRRMPDLRAMGMISGPAQQQKLNEYIARNAAIEHWGPECGLAKYHQHLIDNWDSKPPVSKTQFK